MDIGKCISGRTIEGRLQLVLLKHDDFWYVLLGLGRRWVIIVVLWYWRFLYLSHYMFPSSLYLLCSIQAVCYLHRRLRQ
jgi:hypothetical protein